jgi:hypothetical protein
MVFPIPSGTYTQQMTNETFGEKPFLNFFSPAESRLIKPALDTLKTAKNKEVSKEAEKALLLIKETVSSFQQLSFDLTFLPAIRAFENEDGSVIIEWIFKDYRIGFGIEVDPSDSGWYLVTKRELGEISASGHTSNTNIRNTILWLLNFIVSHS